MTAPIIGTDAWLKLRSDRLSASRFAAALGLDPSSSPLQLWSEMKGLLPSGITGEEEWIQLGKVFERGILKYGAKRCALDLYDFKEAEERFHAEEHLRKVYKCSVEAWVQDEEGHIQPYIVRGDFAATIDGLVLDEERNEWGILEAKNRSAWFGKDFAGGLDEIPPATWCQLGAQLLVTGLDFVVLLAVVGGTKLVPIRASREQFPLDQLEAGGLEFLRYLKSDTPPPAMAREGEAKAVQALHPASNAKGAPIVAPEPLVAAWARYTALGKEIKERNDEREKLKAEALLAIGDAPAAYLPNGKMLKRSRAQRAGYTVQPCEFDDLRLVNQPKDAR